MDSYDEDYTNEVEKEIGKIRSAALTLVQKTHPEIDAVIDRRSFRDYSERVWDYPGKWYTYFRLPDGFRRKEELILAIAEDTLGYYAGKR